MQFDKCEIWLVVSSELERKYRVRNPKKEPWTVAWLESEVGKGQVFYDIGANVGAFSLIAALHCGASVIAFEPGFSNFARLCDNIRVNRCDNRIVPLPWLLADRSELRQFEYRSTEPGQSRHAAAAWNPAAETIDKYRQPICAMPLDELIGLFRLPPPHHIKLDVDGAENDVLRGARQTLRHPSLQSVLIEADAVTGPDVVAALDAAGLRLATRHVREEKPKAPWYGVFVRDRQ